MSRSRAERTTIIVCVVVVAEINVSVGYRSNVVRWDVTVLKDEPEDLTHLAPTPGDVCVPLEDTPFLSDMLDEFILGSDNYCPLLSPDGTLAPELRATDFADPLKDAELGDTARNNKDLGESLADSDPFMYGDSPSSPCSIDPSAVSPPLAKYRQVSRYHRFTMVTLPTKHK